MWAVIVIALQEGFDPLLQCRHLAWFIFAPAKTLFPQSAIKTFDVGLLIFLVGLCHAMTITKQAQLAKRTPFELRAAVVLK